jgi:hypothetical protein
MESIIRGAGVGSAPAADNNASLYDLLAVTHDPYLVNNDNGNAPTAANLHLVKMPWEVTATITTYMLWQGVTVGTGLQNCYLAVVDQAGNVLAPTADLSAALMAAGAASVQSFNAATPAVVPGQPGGWIWAALQIGAATVMPTFGNWGSTLSASLSNVNVAAGRTRCGRIPTGNAALPASIVLANIVPSASRFFIGVK